MWAAIIIIVYLLGIISAINAVMSTRTPQGTIAWIIALLAFPILAVPVYWLLGRSRFKGYVKARQSEDAVVMEKLQSVLESLQPYCVPEKVSLSAKMASEKLAELPYLSGNSVDLLIDGHETFDSIIEGIDSAKDYILFQFFIVKDDEIGCKLKDHLVIKAKQGVRVYFLYDEIGSHKLGDAYKKELRQAGAEVYDFHTQKGFRNRFQVNFRNHRKIVIVDGKVSWIGGHNVGDEYLGRYPEFGHWRDTHIRIEGPAALAAQLSFVEDWFWATDGYINELSWTPVAAKNDNQTVLILPSGPADTLETCTLMFHHAINSARERIWIASPYFVPDDAIVSALQLAGLRGVDVRILIPDKADHLLVYMAAFSYFEQVSHTGVRFFRYTDGFLHQKTMLIDNTVATVGTANFDNRSFRLNFEITAAIADETFVKEIEAMLEEDFAHSYEMSMEDVNQRSFWFKLGVRLARLTSPIQ